MGPLSRIRSGWSRRRASALRRAGRAEAIPALSDHDPATALTAALAALDAGRAEEAETRFAALSGRDPANPAPALFLGVALWDRGDRGGAAEAFARAARAGRANAVREAYAALASWDRGFPAELSGPLPAAPHLRARVLLEAERRLRDRESPAAWAEGYVQALLLSEAPPGPPVPPDATADPEARVVALLRASRPAEALPVLDEIRRSRPDDWVPVLLSGAARLLAGDGEGATRDFDRAAELFPVAGEIHLHRGLARLSRGDVLGARAAFLRLAASESDVLLRRLARARAILST